MAEFNIRSDAVDVEQIMRQIQARIREKRGVDYTEQEIQEMANVKLEKFLDPRGVRSDLVAQFRSGRPEEPPPPAFAFEDSTLYDSHRAPIRWIRRLLRPLLKLFFNPNPLIQSLHIQAQLNTAAAAREATRRELDGLYYEVMHNLVLEMTRLSIEVKNLKMRVESISGRLDFNERRARALEGVVQYRTPAQAAAPARPAPARPAQSRPAPARPVPAPERQAPQTDVVPAETAGQQPETGATPAEGPGTRSRRRRRRRGRRGTGAGQPLPPGADAQAGADADADGGRDDEARGDDSQAGEHRGGDAAETISGGGETPQADWEGPGTPGAAAGPDGGEHEP